MYALIGLAFCSLVAAMIAVQGVSALLWTPVGFAFGLFSGASMILPLMLGVPRAIWLVAKRKMRAAVIGRILITPLIWLVGLFVIFFLIGFLWPSTAKFLSNNAALNLGTSLGWVGIILSPLSAKGRSDFVTDFDKAYHEFYLRPICGTGRQKLVEDETRRNEEAEKIIHDYGACLRSVCVPSVTDTGSLPHSKELIKQALILALHSEIDPKQREALKIAYIRLSDWQEGVGAEPVVLDMTKFDPNADPMELAKRLKDPTGMWERFRKWNDVATKEQSVLKSELQQLGLW